MLNKRDALIFLIGLILCNQENKHFVYDKLTQYSCFSAALSDSKQKGVGSEVDMFGDLMSEVCTCRRE